MPFDALCTFVIRLAVAGAVVGLLADLIAWGRRRPPLILIPRA